MNTRITALAQAMNFLFTFHTYSHPLGRRCRSWWVSTGSIRLPWEAKSEITELPSGDACWLLESCQLHLGLSHCQRVVLFALPSLHQFPRKRFTSHKHSYIFILYWCYCFHTCIFAKTLFPQVWVCQESPSCRLAKIFGEARENRTCRKPNEFSSLVWWCFLSSHCWPLPHSVNGSKPMYFLEKTLQSDPIKFVST